MPTKAQKSVGFTLRLQFFWNWLALSLPCGNPELESKPICMLPFQSLPFGRAGCVCWE
jgi:hypothetical protein